MENLYLFEKDLPPFKRQALKELIYALQQEFLESHKPLFEFLHEKLYLLKDAIAHHHQLFRLYENKYKEASDEKNRQDIILEFAAALGATPTELAKDKKAFSRWFDFEAVADRCRFQISSLERELGFIIERQCLLLTTDLPLSRKPFLILMTDWVQSYPGNYRIKVIALESILKLLKPEDSLNEEIFHYLSISEQKEIWIQCNALSVLKRLNNNLFREVARNRLYSYNPDPDFFVRHHITTLLEEDDFTSTPEFLYTISKDPSDFVRQALCQKISLLPHKILDQLLNDPSPQVRAFALLNTISLRPFEEKVSKLSYRCSHEITPFVMRFCLKSIVDGFILCTQDEKTKWVSTFDPILDNIHSSYPDIPTRRRAAQTRELFWCLKTPHIHKALEELQSLLSKIKPGTSSFIPYTTFENLKKEEIGRLFAVATQKDFGCELLPTRKGYKIFRGQHFKFRFWRFFYEFFHPTTAKREAFRHTIGRIFRGRIQIPSGILAEMTQTLVPGEPLFLHEEGGYRPYLPLVDHLISIARQRKPYEFYTSEGITLIGPPKGFLKRYIARIQLTYRFSSLAELRNWKQEDSYWKPSEYINSIEKLGFQIFFSPYNAQAPRDPGVAQFFPAAFILPDWDSIISFILSSKVSILGISFYILILGLFFVWEHRRNYKKVQLVRSHFPLVIGGWGTRGKSSTERLKGALMNGMGLSVFAKTTGCEATIAIAGPYQKMHEIPYYRPYGKVSIWEQAQTAILANKFKMNVMLWECMGLRPEYVRIIQHQWLKSDLSTLTNAYPDHEDIQGPAGYNVAETLSEFILPKSTFITAEEQMLPILQRRAHEGETVIETTGWLEECLLTQDIIDRFPYKEHAQNIALVLKFASLFGVSKPFALKEMSDNVLPDIGALKVFPIASLNNRKLQFINGMSANEEHGCLTNWTRVGFDKPTPPGTWISTLINNRADRVGRSRIFAQLVVHNLPADKHFLVGTNIHGFMGFVSKAWSDFLHTLPLSDNLTNILEGMVHKLRLCSTQTELRNRLNGMGLEKFKGDILNLDEIRNYLDQQDHPEKTAILHFHKENLQVLHEYETLHHQLSELSDVTHLKPQLTKWFMSKFILNENETPSGDEMVSWIAHHTPPNYLNKVMGVQNIKGPGLEFVSRWQEWEKCYSGGELFLNPIPQKSLQGYRKLMELKEFGVLSKEYLQRLFFRAEEKQKTELENIRKKMEEVKTELERKAEEKRHFLINAFISFFDIYISLFRRRKVNKIYDDLSKMRISYIRAKEELDKIIERDVKE